MARQPRRGASPASRQAQETPYQYRLRRFRELHPERVGVPGAARGHHPREHVTRAETAAAKGKLTEREKGMIRRFANRQAERMDRDPAEARAELVAKIAERGFPEFERMRRYVEGNVGAQRKRIRKWIKTTRDGKVVRLRIDLTGRSERGREMQEWADEWGLDWEWFWYH